VNTGYVSIVELKVLSRANFQSMRWHHHHLIIILSYTFYLLFTKHKRYPGPPPIKLYTKHWSM